MLKRFALVACGLAIVGSTADGAVRKVMMEEFTNVRCGPCATHHPWLEQHITNHYPSDMIVIYYHMSWPGYDPYYAENPGDNNARRSYYGVNAVPHNRQDAIEPERSCGTRKPCLEPRGLFSISWVIGTCRESRGVGGARGHPGRPSAGRGWESPLVSGTISERASILPCWRE